MDVNVANFVITEFDCNCSENFFIEHVDVNSALIQQLLTSLSRLYAAHETLTEPHRLTATMQCLTWMARSMMIHDKLRCHAIPLLHMSLPGIDPNDHFKCMITFHFISVFASLVTFVDCHSAVDFNDDLSEVMLCKSIQLMLLLLLFILANGISLFNQCRFQYSSYFRSAQFSETHGDEAHPIAQHLQPVYFLAPYSCLQQYCQLHLPKTFQVMHATLFLTHKGNWTQMFELGFAVDNESEWM